MQSSESLSVFDSGRYSFNPSQLSDAKLRTDDGCTFDIHRVILVGKSDYFGDMFCGMDRDSREFTIPGISGECLNNILCYIYTGVIQITESNVRDLMITTDYLLLKDLQMEIKQSIKANVTELNCLEILKAADQISDKDIYQECFRFIQTKFERVVRCQKDELANLPLEIFRSILSDRSLYVYNETTVWQTIVEWTKKDIQSRECCVPQLLLTLAIEDLGEELATEILQHEIISKNSLMKDLRSSNDFTSNLDVFSSFLLNYSDPLTQPHSHRIPPNLYVISADDRNLYITYDENLDLWRKITEVTNVWSHRNEFLIAIGHNIYMFSCYGCMNFDLSVMDWVTMENFWYRYGDCVVAIDAYIYLLGQNREDQKYVLQVYDTVNSRWFNVAPLPNILYGLFVAIEKKIYLVGNSRSFDGMMTQMFDPVTQEWSLLSPPPIKRSLFTLVAYHEKIYLIGGMNWETGFSFLNAEVFDPSTNLWKELPNLPYSYTSPKAVVYKDQIIVYDSDYNVEHDDFVKNVRWNDTTECWEKVGKTHILKDLHRHRVCTVNDVETIRMLTKQNRDPRIQMQKSLFI